MSEEKKVTATTPKIEKGTTVEVVTQGEVMSQVKVVGTNDISWVLNKHLQDTSTDKK